MLNYSYKVQTNMTSEKSKMIMMIMKMKRYIKLNWGTPFIFTFIILLSSAGCSLVFGVSSLADALSEYAFYALVIGVGLQIFCSLKHRESNPYGAF
jgi:hypothetical protein